MYLIFAPAVYKTFITIITHTGAKTSNDIRFQNNKPFGRLTPVRAMTSLKFSSEKQNQTILISHLKTMTVFIHVTERNNSKNEAKIKTFKPDL